MYLPLRTHGHHTLLTGVDAPETLCRRARELGMDALALTDVDSLAGLTDFLRAAERVGVRPIVGAELSDPRGAPGRLVALVRTEEGYRNLNRLVSARQLGADPGEVGAGIEDARPEDLDLVHAAVRWRAGLTFLVDHPRLVFALAGRVPAEHLLVAVAPSALGVRPRASVRRAARGEERNVHLAPPPPCAAGRPVEGRAERTGDDEDALGERKVPPPEPPASALDLVEAARATRLATVAAPDVHYARPEGRRHHRARVAIKHNALLEGLPESWLAAEPAHLVPPAELEARYADLPDARGPFGAPQGVGALERTLEVGAACTYVPPLGGVHFPDVALGEHESAYSRLCALAFEGAHRRYRPLRPEVVRRLDHELSSIDALGFAAYFLLVRQIADFAAREEIPCVGRGSAADSLVAYCLGLTDADPLRYRLPFERFLNPQRGDRPDIDLDFCWRRRDEVIEHVYEAFGPERTAMIATVATFGLRSAFREAALVQGIPPAVVTRWSRRLPWHVPRPGAAAGAFDGTVDDDPDAAGGAAPPLRGAAPGVDPVTAALAATPECRDFPFDDPAFARALEVAGGLVDAPRHFGLHPGGVVVSPGPITDFVACQRAAKGVVTTQLDKDGVEAVGLVKMDLLGNRALTVIRDCEVELARRGVTVDWEGLPEDDPRTAALLARGGTLGCFQVESPGMRNLLQQTRAADMDAVIQAVALIRPGPAGSGMKDAYVLRLRGLEEPRAPHPRLTELLWDTRGVMLYQEDVMQAASLLAGFDLAEADTLRRVLKRREGAELERARARFLAGCAENGVPEEEARPVWERIEGFVSFAFCKAHAVTYGRIAYRTVWLKAHHPAEFLTAFLASRTGYYEPRVYVEEARRLGVPILGPDVNRSAETFAVERLDPAAPPALRIGLDQVKGITAGTLERLLEARRAGGAFVSLPDFLARTGARVDETEHLVQCGAFDALDRTRPELLWRLHLLRAPERRPPRGAWVAENGALDPGQLAACRATPASRERSASTGGWGQRGIGAGALELAPGESAPLFPPPEVPALALPRLPDLGAQDRALLEYELLGLTVSLHPTRLFPCEADERLRAARVRRIDCREVPGRAGERVALRGWLAASRRVHTADGRWMRFLTLEDETALAEVVLFPDVYERDGHRLVDRGPFCISGTVEDHLGACTLHADRIW